MCLRQRGGPATRPTHQGPRPFLSMSRAEGGMATAELAVAMPAVVLVLLLVLAAVSAGVTQLRVTDAARVAARQAAMGSGDVVTAAQRVAPGVGVSVDRGELTCVTVSRPVAGPLGGMGLTARSRACAYTEPDS